MAPNKIEPQPPRMQSPVPAIINNLPPPAIPFLNQVNQNQLLLGEIRDTPAQFQVEVNVSDFKPNDVRVHLRNGTLIIHGEKAVSVGNGTFKREFQRHFSIPEDCDMTAAGVHVQHTGDKMIVAIDKKKPGAVAETVSPVAVDKPKKSVTFCKQPAAAGKSETSTKSCDKKEENAKKS